jgi:hypothetical protein
MEIMATDDKSRKITIDDLGAKLVEALKSTGNLQDPANQWKVIMEHLIYSLSIYDQLTPEAQKVTDEMQKEVLSFIEQQLPFMPDTLETRQLRRATRGAKGKRLYADGYIKVLENPLATPSDLFNKTRDFFGKYLQLIMDLYQDISDNTFGGTANFCKYSLIGICIDELLVAHHLCQHSYASQAFSHIRTIQEAIDLIELFNKEPQWADLWISDKSSQEIRSELKPSQVRKKLGKDETFGKIYSMFSVSGTHPSFEMLRAKCRKSVELSPKGNPQFSISIGGMPKTKEAVFTPIFLLFSMVMVLVQLVNSFGKYLNEQEVLKILGEVTSDFLVFFENGYIKPLKDSSVELKEMEAGIQKIKDELLKGLNIRQATVG